MELLDVELVEITKLLDNYIKNQANDMKLRQIALTALDALTGNSLEPSPIENVIEYSKEEL